MEAAKMIDDGKLRQGFILATLISTVAGTFITGINLYDRLIEQRRQRKLDRGQNRRIKELEQRLNEAEAEKARIANGRGGEKKDDDGDRGVRDSLAKGGPMVQREYDRLYADLGPRFAHGDLIARTQIQSHIIVLQSSVIRLLEEALVTGQPPDISRLYNTSEFAREGSIRALRDQYQRLLQAAPLQPQPRPRPPGLVRRISSTPSLTSRYSTESGWGPRRSARNAITYDRGGPLFCRFAEAVQRGRSLDSCTTASTVSSSASVRCAACGVTVGAGDGDDPARAGSWRIEKEVAIRCLPAGEGRRYSRESDGVVEDIVVRSFLLTRRFVFKCHREDSGYACYLCFCCGDRDTLCRSEESLVSHVASKHSISQYAGDEDIRELGQAALALPH